MSFHANIGRQLKRQTTDLAMPRLASRLSLTFRTKQFFPNFLFGFQKKWKNFSAIFAFEEFEKESVGDQSFSSRSSIRRSRVRFAAADCQEREDRSALVGSNGLIESSASYCTIGWQYGH
jgi:hypothetical protein